jgi:maleylacetoacetate isomerase/maleylpyruvate isomerase
MKLYSYWRSQATFRVRVALNLKGIAVEDSFIHLEKGDQYTAAYKAVNPLSVVPSLVLDDGTVLTQSMAILEYLEEVHPAPPLLPKSPLDRARVRAICQIAVSDSHPLMVPRVRHYLERELHLDEATRARWIHHWIGAAMGAIETQLTGDPRTGKFCHGDAPTLADVCLVAQIVGARGQQFDLTPYPTSVRIADDCLKLAPFASAHPRLRPDAPKQN